MNATLPNDIVFTTAVKAAQQQRGSRDMYARMEAGGQFPSKVDRRLADFVAARDSFYFGTASRDGQPYIQHRGGPKGFLKVLDENRLAFADVAGNAQYISVGNLDENNRAFIFLMDYQNRRRIKLWGTAEVIEDDDDLLQQLATDEVPERAIVFHLSAWNANCPKNIHQRWTIDEVDERMRALSAEVERLKQENRSLKRQLTKPSKEQFSDDDSKQH